MSAHSGLINETTRGVYVIAATPFADNGELDLESVDSLTDFYLDKGVTGLTILGMMGEARRRPRPKPRPSCAACSSA